MNLSQLTTAVAVETNRPDMANEIMQAVLEATLSVHTVENFYKDIVEAPITFDSPLYIQQLPVSLLENFRDIAYIRKTDPAVTALEQTTGGLPLLNSSPTTGFPFGPTSFIFMKRVDIGNVIDMYGYEKQDIWYQAGQTVNIKSSTPLTYATIAWYQYPNLDPTGVLYNSWIATEYPYAIIYKAAGTIFAKIGEDKAWAIYMKAPIPGQGYETGGMFYQMLANIVRNNIRAGD